MVRDPQFGVPKSADELTTQDPCAVVYGITPGNEFIPLKIDSSGRMEIAANVTLDASDVEIGAVEIKNYNTDDRVFVSTNHEILAQARLYDASGNVLTSTSSALDVHIASQSSSLGVTLTGGLTTDDDDIAAGMDVLATASLLYGYDGVNWQRIKSASGRLIIDGSQVTQPVSGSVSVTNFPATQNVNVINVPLAVTQSGVWSVTANIGTTGGLALDSTLLGIKSQTDQFTFSTGSLNSNITNSSLAVTQSGIWSTGRTWVLTSGTDSVSAVQSGTWNINNISGTVSLPTGASTEATLLAVKTDTDKFTFASTRLLVDGSGVTQPVSGSVSVSNFPAVQPVSGTVTANIGTTNGLALDATLTNASQKTQIVDGLGNVISSTSNALDVNLKSPIQVSVDTSHTDDSIQIWGTDGVTDRFIKTDATGQLQVVITNATLAVTQSGTWTTGRTWTLSSGTDSVLAAQSGTWNINNISGTISLPTGASTELTLSAINTKLVAGTVIGDVNAAQKGTWNINNISGTISLPTGAATETTLAGIKTDLDKFTFASTRLLVDGSGVTQPISGTITANQGTSPWVISGTVTANAGTGNFTVVQATGTNLHTVVDSGSITANIGTTGGLALDTSVVGLQVSQGSTTSGQKGSLILGAVTTAAPLYTTAQSSPLSLDTSGRLRIDNSSWLGSIAPTVGQKTMSNSIPVVLASDQAAISVQIVPTSNIFFAFGDVSTSVTSQVPVRRTVYTEQTTNGQRSFVSSSASDAGAGTGAQQVQITFYDQTGSGPNTEIITLNGTTAVNTVSTTIAFIDSIQVTRVGSGGSNAGTITLKAGIGGGGATIWTINPGDNQTFSSHHYVPTGKTAIITGISCGSNSTTVGAGALFILKAISLNLPGAVELQISDFVRLYGQSSTFSRTYNSPIKVVGPARITQYVTPESSTTITQRGAFDFTEQ